VAFHAIDVFVHLQNKHKIERKGKEVSSRVLPELSMMHAMRAMRKNQVTLP
jgi:hypothetical protein